MRANISRVIEQSWQGVNLISIALLPVSLVYCLLMKLRRFAYATGFLKSHKVDCPVVVVGNLSVGGTGKTPFTIWLAGWLMEQGFSPGIVLRGYGGQSVNWPAVVTPESDPREVGDEALLYARRLNIPVVVGPSRFDDCRKLLANHACDVILCDDGLQHLALARDFEIALVRKRHGNDWCLPAGPLREARSRLASIDRVIHVDSDAAEIKPVPGLARQIADHENSVGLDDFRGLRILAVAGIANPERFFCMLENAGLNIERRVFPDHHDFSPADIEAKGFDAVLMTEKDAVKCRDFATRQHWQIPLTLEIESGLTDDLRSSLIPALNRRHD